VVAQNITVELTLAPAVKLVNTYGTPYETSLSNKRNENIYTARFKLGDLVAGKRKILLMEIKPPRSVEGEILLANVLLTYDDLLGRKGRQEHRQKISVIATRKNSLVKRSVDNEVRVFAKMALISETIDLVIKSMDAGLHKKAHKLLVNEYKEIASFAKETNDRELLEGAMFIKHLAEELEEIEKAKSLHKHHRSMKDLRKDLQYKSYLLRHLQGGH